MFIERQKARIERYKNAFKGSWITKIGLGLAAIWNFITNPPFFVKIEKRPAVPFTAMLPFGISFGKKEKGTRRESTTRSRLNPEVLEQRQLLAADIASINPDPGLDNADFITNQNSFTLEGTSTPTQFLDVNENGSNIGGTTAGSSGNWSFSLSRGEGSYNFEAVDSFDSVGDTQTVIVDQTTPNNVTISVAPGGGTYGEGSAITLSGSATDPIPSGLTASDISGLDDAAAGSYAWTITKDGNAFDTGDTKDFTFTPDDNGNYVASLVVTDIAGNSAAAVTQGFTVTNEDPVPTIVGAPAVSSPEGTEISLTSTVADAGTADTVATYAWSVTKDGSAFGSTGATDAFAFTPDDEGTYVVTLTVTDDDGGSGTTTESITVTNEDPVPTIVGAPAVSSPEGTEISLASTVADAGTTDTVATYAWSVTKDGSAFGSTGATDSFAFTPDDNGTYVVTLTVTDNDGGSGTTTESITVTNEDPVPTIVGAPAVSSPEGTEISLTSTVADAGTIDTVATYAWSVTKDGSAFGSTGATDAFAFTP
ncbi:PKD domain-containing protein, partial [Rhodopirellula bahusiensis]